MRLIDEILEKEPPIYNSQREFANLENKQAEDIAKSLFEKIINIIQIDKISGYKNDGEIKNAKFIHPDNACNQNEDKNTITATKRSDGSFYAEPEPNIERMIKLAWNKFKKDGICENQFPIPDTGKKGINIDLITRKNDTIELIELKQWNNPTNPPTFAIAELIKNLYMFSHLYQHLFTFTDYQFNKDFNIEYYKELYNLKGIKKFILTVLAPDEYYTQHFKSSAVKNTELLKEKYYQFCLCLKNLIRDDLRNKLNKSITEIEIRTQAFTFNRDEQYEKIKNKIINNHTCQPNFKYVKTKSGGDNTGNIDLNKYFEDENYFPKSICEQLTNRNDYIKTTDD